MGEIEHPTINEMKVIVECEQNGIKLCGEDTFNVSEIEDLCGYMIDEWNEGGFLSDSQSEYTDEFGNTTGIGTDVLYQAKTIVNEIEGLQIYKDAKKIIEICKKHDVKELEFMER